MIESVWRLDKEKTFIVPNKKQKEVKKLENTNILSSNKNMYFHSYTFPQATSFTHEDQFTLYEYCYVGVYRAGKV